MRKNHSKIVCIKLVHLPYLQLERFMCVFLETTLARLWISDTCQRSTTVVS